MSVQRLPVNGPSLKPVLRRLQALGSIGPELVHRIEELGRRAEALPAKSVLQTEGEGAVRPRYILSGWACRQRLLSDGRRQIFSILLPGDGLGLCRQPRPVNLANTVALTRLVVVDAAPILSPATMEACPEWAEVLNLASALDDTYLLDQIVRLGRQTAYERTAHLLLELNTRLSTVGLVEDGGYELPLTQEVLADVLGLSTVHMNRTVQQLRRDRMVELSSGRVRLLDPAQLADAVDYRRPAIMR